MKKRIAIPVINENQIGHFGECSHYVIYEIAGSSRTLQKIQLPGNEVVSELPQWLDELGITDVIAFRMNPGLIKLFASRKITLYVGVQADKPEILIDKYLQGKLESDNEIINELLQLSD